MPSGSDNLYIHEGATSDSILGTKYVPSTARHLYVVLAGQHTRTYVAGNQSLVLTAAALSLTVPALATHADIMAESTSATDYCRFWDGGATPTSSVGMKLGPGAPGGPFWESASPATFKAINSSGACTLMVAYFYYS